MKYPDSVLPMLADKMKGAMAKDTTNTFYASAMATVYEVKDDYLNAARCYEESYRWGVDYEINSIYENYFKARKYDKALWWIDEAIKTDSNFTSYEEKSAILLEMGDLEGVISTMDDALHIDPNSTKFHYHKGVYYKFMRRYDEAIQLFTKIITLDKNFTAAWYQRGSLYMLQGKTAEARADLRKVIDKDDIAYKPLAYALLKKPREAKAAIDSLLKMYDNSAYALYMAANVYSLLNDRQQPISYLKQCYEKGWSRYMELVYTPYYDNLRDEPEFKALVQWYLKGYNDNNNENANGNDALL